MIGGAIVIGVPVKNLMIGFHTKIMILELITYSFSGKSSFEYKPTKKNDCLVLVASIVACREEP